MYNRPGLIQAPSFTVYPTVVVTMTLAEHSAESDLIDAANVRHAKRNYGSCRRKVKLLIAAAHARGADPLQEFSVY